MTDDQDGLGNNPGTNDPNDNNCQTIRISGPMTCK